MWNKFPFAAHIHVTKTCARNVKLPLEILIFLCLRSEKRFIYIQSMRAFYHKSEVLPTREMPTATFLMHLELFNRFALPKCRLKKNI